MALLPTIHGGVSAYSGSDEEFWRWVLRVLLSICLVLVSAFAWAGPKEDASAKKKAGDKLLAEGDISGALAAYDEAKTLFQDPEFELARGEVLLKLRRYQEARTAFQTYLDTAKNPKYKNDVKKSLLELDKIEKTTLSCESEPTGATIYLNSRLDGEVGPTPIKFNLPPGTHRVIFDKPGFKPKTELVTVKEGDNGVVKTTLVVAPYTIEVSSTPPNAEIFVDGQPQGKTPGTIELAEGPHSLELRLAGFQTLTQKTAGKAGEKQQLAHTFLDSPGELLLTTNPPSAGIIEITGKEITGKVGEILSLPAGKYNVVVKSKGYKEAATVVTLEKGKRFESNVTIEVLPVRLLVKANVEGFTTTIDDAPQAITGNSFELSPGKHKVKVETPEHTPYETEIELKPGEPLYLDAALKLKHRKNTYIVGGAGAAAVLAGIGIGIAALVETGKVLELNSGPDDIITPEEAKKAINLSKGCNTALVVSGGLIVVFGYRFLAKEGASKGTISPLPENQ